MSLAVWIYIIVCILSILIFLLQQAETGGMGIVGGASNSLLGSTRTTFLAKVATFFAVLFFISALFLSILSSGRDSLFQSQTLPSDEIDLGVKDERGAGELKAVSEVDPATSDLSKTETSRLDQTSSN